MTHTITMMKAVDRIAAWTINLAVVAYRATFGLFMSGHCRYTPSCSQYMLDAVAKYGPWRGGWRGVKRICRCHPFGASGYDPP